MSQARPTKLDPPVDIRRDHILGDPEAELTLVQYGSYADFRSRAVHAVVEGLRNRFGDRMRYVFRHLPVEGKKDAFRAAEVSERVAATTGKFWEVHEAFMERGPTLTAAQIEEAAGSYGGKGIAQNDAANDAHADSAKTRVREDIESAKRSGAIEAPVFFINGRRYTGTWDESSLADALLAPLGHRIQAAAFRFVRWGPSSGVLLGLATLLAIILSNSPLAAVFAGFWEKPLGVLWEGQTFAHSLLHWVNHGLLTVFFFVVGLEIKREFSVGHLATLRSGALPVIAAFGGILLPAVIYAAMAPPELRHGWGIPIGTDTAFAVAIIVFLGARVPIELRVFLTAAVIIDDIVAILVIAFFYTDSIDTAYLIAGAITTILLILLNRMGIYRVLPYACLGIILWFFLHQSGLHATLAGVILAVLIPARPPANLKVLLAQAATVINREDNHTNEAMREGPSEPTLRTLDAIHGRIESPADRMLRTMEPWSSYLVLPIFALANAGVTWSSGVLAGQWRLVFAIAFGLVIGKPVGIVVASWLAVRSGIAEKPDAYSWRQLCGAGALGGIGFTMSLFIAGIAFPELATTAAAKIAIFIASLVAGTLGVVILLKRQASAEPG